jgi:hypothetical protein
MQQEGMSLLEFQERFSTEQECRDHLFALRWPEGFRCPRCGCGRYSWHSTRHLCQCSACRYQASVTAGTILHKTRTPLRKWFWMIFMMSRQKSGVSMLGLQSLLEIKSYKTVWTMGHKIRKAMAERDAHYKLAGVMEMDDAFIGPIKPGKSGRGAEGKAKFIVAVGRRGERAGFATMQCVDHVAGKEVIGLAQAKMELGSTIVTDGWHAYRCLSDNGFSHEHVVLMKDKKPLKELKWAHVLIANLKGNIRGVHHNVSRKHLQRYIVEYCYRFNRRFWASQLFDRTLVACAGTQTITFAELRT